MTFGEKVIDFYKLLKGPEQLPKKVEVLFPFADEDVMATIAHFNHKYFNDANPRTFLIGINPGRLGSGTTGIPFTDPIRLKSELHIDNKFETKQELSSNFVYQMIQALGGPESFYRQFYFTSVSPVGFIMDGKNLNYYDIPALQEGLESYIIDNLKTQIGFGAKPVAFSMGMGKNIAYLSKLNAKYRLFEKIEPLPHPRWIMQYRLKRIREFIDMYKNMLETQSKNL